MEIDDEPGPDYVTLMPARFGRACVAVMSWNHTEHEYQMKRCSESLMKNAAEHLAQSWAAAMGVGIR